jgi:surface antigen/LysM repeat protein
MTHGIVLVAVVALPALHTITGHGFATAGLGGVIGAEGASAQAAMSLDRGFLLRPLPSTSIAPPPDRPKAINYTALRGDTLNAIAVRFGLRIDTLRFSNNLNDSDSLKPGQQIIIPPTNGILVRATPGDTINSLAQKYHYTSKAIIDYNLIRDPDHLTPGSLVMLPDGTGVDTAQDIRSGLPSSSANAIPFGHSDYNHFPWGWCTWWVASQRDIPWNGNAWQWFGEAQASGFAVGKTPRVGAVMVTWESRYYGHVALVEQVFPDGSWLVSEMNYRGYGVVDRRHIGMGEVPLIGFIY